MTTNVFVLIGNLGGDPEAKYFESGRNVTKFSLAYNSPYKKEGEKPDWFRCEAWGKIGETIAQYCKKGSKVSVSGSLKTETYPERDTGREITRVVLNCEKVELLTPKDKTEEGQASTPAVSSAPPQQPVAPAVRQPVAPVAAATAEADPNYDDIPFQL